MAKMRIFEFWNSTGTEEKTEQLSLKRAVKLIQSKFKDRFVSVKYISKKGYEVTQTIKLPWGRSKKLSK